jgi:hypothetical protein
MLRIYVFVIFLVLFISIRDCPAVEKAVKFIIPVCTNSLANAVVVGILEDVPGVRHARVNGMDSAATVFFDNATTSVSELRKELGKANIQVEGVTVPRDAQGRLITR